MYPLFKTQSSKRFWIHVHTNGRKGRKGTCIHSLKPKAVKDFGYMYIPMAGRVGRELVLDSGQFEVICPIGAGRSKIY